MKQDPIPLPPGLSFIRRLQFPRKLGVLERIYGRILCKQGVQWVQTSNGIIWKLDLSDVTQRWIVYGDYEGPLQMQWIMNWLSGGGLVVDSGANIGQMLLYLAPLSGVHVLAFEPVQKNRQWLQQCLSLYPSWSVQLIEKGLSDAEDVKIFQLDGGRSTTRLDWYQGKDLETMQLAVVRLDQVVSGETIRLWKLDVEGGELEALAGATRLFEEKKIDAVLVEVCKDHLTAMTDFLKPFGYVLYTFGHGGQLAPAPEALTETTNLIVLQGDVEHSLRI